MESRKLDIVDEETILEISTFVVKGASFEASDGNHDDLMMNLVMFGYFVSQQYFGDLTDIDLKQMLFETAVKDIDDDLPPFGFIDDGSEAIAQIDMTQPQEHWATDRPDYGPDNF